MLIAGIGNPIMGDDGAGIEVVRRLEKEKLAQDVELFEAGVDSFGLLRKLKGRKKVVLVDAVRGAEEGKVYRLAIEDLKGSGFIYTLHDFALEHLLETGRELFKSEFPGDVIIVGIGVEKAEQKIGLSSRVERGVERAVEYILKEAEHVPRHTSKGEGD